MNALFSTFYVIAAASSSKTAAGGRYAAALHFSGHCSFVNPGKRTSDGK
jgi:hypothetical protein